MTNPRLPFLLSLSLVLFLSPILVSAATNPTILGISPPNPNNLIRTVWGTNFQPGAKLFIDGKPPTALWQGGTQFLVFEVPPITKTGPVSVTVTNPDGGSATLPGGFTAQSAAIVPIIRGVAPNAITGLGTVWGENFERGAKLFINGTAPAGLWQVGTQFLVFQPPTGSSGTMTVTVKVVNPSGGTATLTATYSYTPPPPNPNPTPMPFPVPGPTPSPTPPPNTCNSNGIKWHPGNYVWLDMNTSQAAHFAVINQLGSDATIKGFQIVISWSALEGATKGDYSKGFALIDSYLAELAKQPTKKYLFLQIKERGFGGHIPPAQQSPTDGLVPQYLATPEYGGGIEYPQTGGISVIAKSWTQPVMDRLIALSQAYAARYDTNPNFETLSLGETVIGGITNTNVYDIQIRRWMDASKLAWKHTQMRLNANFDYGPSGMADLITYSTTGGGVVVGGPDILPWSPTGAQKIFAADPQAYQKYPIVGEYQSSNYRSPTVTAADFYNYAHDTMHMSYMIWPRNDYAEIPVTPAQAWATGKLPFIHSVNGAVFSSACPAAYNNKCVTNLVCP